VANATPAGSGAIFEVEQEGDTVIAVPAVDLGELDYQRIEDGARRLLGLLGGGGVRNVVLDFHRTDRYGSTALTFFVKLWKRVRGQDGRMALCNVSDHEKEVLRVMKLDGLWPVCSSRAEALAAVKG
jgi:anti-anti-sigma factor